MSARIGRHARRSPAAGGRAAGQLPAWWWRALLSVLLAAGAGLLAWRALAALGTVVTIVVLAWFLSLALDPPVSRLESWGLRRGTAAGAVLLGGLLAAAGAAWLFGDVFVRQLLALVATLPKTYVSVAGDLEARFGVDLLPPDQLASEVLHRWGDDVAAGVLGLTTAGATVLFVGSSVVFVGYSMCTRALRMRAAICRLLTPGRQREVLALWEVTQNKVSDYINSRIALAGIAAAAMFVALVLLRLPYALPLAAFAGVVSQFVPTVGTYIGGALPVAVALAAEPWKAAAVLVYLVLYQQVENVLIAPRIALRALEVDPALSLLGVLAFGAVFGPLGAFLALPVVATVQAVSSTYVRRHELVESALLAERAPRRGSRRGSRRGTGPETAAA